MLFNRNRTVVLCSLACLSVSAAWADQIVMKNGDRVTGSVVKKDGNNLTVKTDQFGAVTLAWDQMVSIKTDKPVNIVLSGWPEDEGDTRDDGCDGGDRGTTAYQRRAGRHHFHP